MDLRAKHWIEQMGIRELADVIRDASAPMADRRAALNRYLIVLDTWGGVPWGSVSIH